MAKILVVEDDQTILEAYKTVLALEGHEVQSAHDGSEALGVLEREKFDILVLDMLMPKMNGLELLRRIQPKDKLPETKVIVFSNMSMPETIAEAKELGVSEYLTKAKFTPKQMVAAVSRLMEIKEAADG